MGAACDQGAKCFIMGVRRDDPDGGKMTTFKEADPWVIGKCGATFMRCNPLLDWTYGDVWRFLRASG